jgi:putative YphP/YqiW family bacilliredoxin
MPYPEYLIAPMREDLTRAGLEELRTAEAVDAAVRDTKGTLMIVVNSVCGCAAGKARPGIAMSLNNAVKPDRLTTVFAGGDVAATERARAYFAPHPPSSPSVGILRDGKVVFMLHRHEIETRGADQIAAALKTAYNTYCATAPVA